MKRWMIGMIACSLFAACGGSGASTAKDDAPKEEVVATTDDAPADDAATESTDEPASTDESTLPPPPDVEAAPPNADSSDSGLAWIVLTPGDGAGNPTVESTIKVHYSGWTTDGKMFDSSVVRGEPIEFPLNKLIAGWQEGIPLMSKGEKRRFWIPEDLAYGKSTRPDAPKGLLVFDIELIDFR